MSDSAKKILIIDDSALMRRMICDIINTDEKFEVADMAADGAEGLIFLSQNKYDIVILDVVMPRVDGLTVLRNMRQLKDAPPVIMFSSEVGDGTSVTIQALELGAFDFIKKPKSILDAKKADFRDQFLETLRVAVESKKRFGEKENQVHKKATFIAAATKGKNLIDAKANNIVAIASSTGGPKALQRVLPKLPANLNAPVLIVQHMPAGFTASLAQRLNELSAIRVVEAKEGMTIEKGTAYLAMGGMHMEVTNDKTGEGYVLHLSDGSTREGVKPCANYMYESLAHTGYDAVLCVVLTGMGQDGTKGIQNLKSEKNVYTIAQDEESCVVYGMPRAAVNAGLADQIEPIDEMAEAISKIMGVQ